jgi:hypothetical protein
MKMGVVGVIKTVLYNRLIVNNIGVTQHTKPCNQFLMTIANKDPISNHLVSLYCKYSLFCVKKGVFL